MAVVLRLPSPLVELIDAVIAARPADGRPEDEARENYMLAALIRAAQQDAALLGHEPTITVGPRRSRQ